MTEKKITPKERRATLYHSSKPTLRQAGLDDMGWFYAAHKLLGEDTPKEDFKDTVIDALSQWDRVYILEDRNDKFNDKQGPVGVVTALFDGWKLEPHVEWFPWATQRNKLRCAIAFLMRARYSSDIGVTIICATSENAPFFKKIKKYAPIYPIGKIPHGRPTGEEHLFYIRGKKMGEIHECG